MVDAEVFRAPRDHFLQQGDGLVVFSRIAQQDGQAQSGIEELRVVFRNARLERVIGALCLHHGFFHLAALAQRPAQP